MIVLEELQDIILAGREQVYVDYIGLLAAFIGVVLQTRVHL